MSLRAHRLANDAPWAAAAAAAAGALTRLRRGARTDCLLQTRLLLVPHELSSRRDDVRVGSDADADGCQTAGLETLTAHR